MSESLTSRVGRIVAGGFHAMLDAVENASPEQVLEQAIREVDAAIADVRTDLGRVEAQRHLTAKRLAEDSARQEALADQAREAVRQQRDDLAEAAIERQIDLEAQMPVLEARLSELGEDKSRLEGYITALQAKKREMRQALDDFRAAREQQASPTGTATGGDHRGESVQARYRAGHRCVRPHLQAPDGAGRHVGRQRWHGRQAGGTRGTRAPASRRRAARDPEGRRGVIDWFLAPGSGPFVVALLVMLGLALVEVVALVSGVGLNDVDRRVRRLAQRHRSARGRRRRSRRDHTGRGRWRHQQVPGLAVRGACARC